MAWEINEENEITLTRGDTLRAEIEIMVDEEIYDPVEGDSVRFALKHRTLKEVMEGYKEFEDEEPLVVVNIPIDTMILEIAPEATKPLPFGKYKYDLEITMANGDVETFVENKLFTITPEVD